jgi:hypothetical protein
MPVIQLHGKCKQEDHGFMVQAGPGINMRPYSKESYAGRVVQVIEYLPSNCNFKFQYHQKKRGGGVEGEEGGRRKQKQWKRERRERILIF